MTVFAEESIKYRIHHFGNTLLFEGWVDNESKTVINDELKLIKEKKKDFRSFYEKATDLLK